MPFGENYGSMKGLPLLASDWHKRFRGAFCEAYARWFRSSSTPYSLAGRYHKEKKMKDTVYMSKVLLFSICFVECLVRHFGKEFNIIRLNTRTKC